MEEAGLKNIPSEHTTPSEYPVPSMGRTREQHNSHKGGTREKHKSYKRQSIETKRRPAITRQTPCSDDQTLKLHHVRTLTPSKRGRRFGVKYDMDRQREATIYKKNWTPRKPCGLFRFSVRSALKLRTPFLGEEDEGAL